MAKNDILEAAKAVLEKEGLDGLTIRKVAMQSGVSPMAIYRHFADKDALINALTGAGLEAWEARVRVIAVDDPVGWLEALTEAFLAFSLEEPNLFDAAFFLPASQARRYPDDFVAGRSPVIAMAMVRIDQGRLDGRLDHTSAFDIVLSLSALAQGMVSMQRARRFTSDEQFKTLFRTAIRHCLQSYSQRPVGKTA